jgi:hypothetical protein
MAADRPRSHDCLAGGRDEAVTIAVDRRANMQSMSTRLVFVALLASCAPERTEPPVVPTTEATADRPARDGGSTPKHANAAPGSTPTGSDAAFLAIVAREYKTWRLADDELHWAPGLCRLPMRGGEHISRAAKATHDGKLFRLWAYDLDAYGVAAGWIDRAGGSGTPTSRGTMLPEFAQVLVKESFVAEPWHPGDKSEFGAHHAMRDGKPFRPGDPIGLFVMLQLATPRDGTDDGWIYGTVAPDGTVSPASDSGMCRDCHATRPNRVFGIPRPPALGM